MTGKVAEEACLEEAETKHKAAACQLNQIFIIPLFKVVQFHGIGAPFTGTKTIVVFKLNKK